MSYKRELNRTEKRCTDSTLDERRNKPEEIFPNNERPKRFIHRHIRGNWQRSTHLQKRRARCSSVYHSEATTSVCFFRHVSMSQSIVYYWSGPTVHITTNQILSAAQQILNGQLGLSDGTRSTSQSAVNNEDATRSARKDDDEKDGAIYHSGYRAPWLINTASAAVDYSGSPKQLWSKGRNPTCVSKGNCFPSLPEVFHCWNNSDDGTLYILNPCISYIHSTHLMKCAATNLHYHATGHISQL